MVIRGHRQQLDIAGCLVLWVVLLCLPVTAQAIVIFDNWTSNNANVGSYVVTVEHNTSTSSWDFMFTVLPWDTEGRGLFVDLGDYDLTDTPVLSNVSWYPSGVSGNVEIKYTDYSGKTCGRGCNINGLNPPLPDPDGEWELVFELADKHYDGIQTFNFSVNDSALTGITDSDWGLMAVRSRHLCDQAGDTLPDDLSDCHKNDKAYAFGQVPAPGTPVLIGLGLLLLARVRHKAR